MHQCRHFFLDVPAPSGYKSSIEPETGRISDDVNIFSRQLSEIDQFGVERSPKMFMRRPELDLLVKRDLFWRDETMSQLEKAVAMLENDLDSNKLLREAWDFGTKERPDYASVMSISVYKD